jgi:hypothetical protein
VSTEKQIQANRENSRKSTGPRTTDGKAKSSKNSLKHALLSKDVVVYGEQISEYQMFRESLIENLHPEGAMEILLVEKIVSYAWRQRRAIQAESSFFHNGLSCDWNRQSLESLFQGSDGQCLQNLTRYETAMEKSFYKAIHQLKELQEHREAGSWNVRSDGFVS